MSIDVDKQVVDTVVDSQVNSGQLKSFIERIERLDEERQIFVNDIKDVYAEAKAIGFVGKIIKKIIKLRKQDRDKRIEEETILDLYMQAIEMN